jgi:release factor glutamine methyltransferase
VGLGIDRSPEALGVARRNATQNGVGERAFFVLSDWGSAAAGSFDLVVANPPYIAEHAIQGLDSEVRDHDPRAALDGGPDGLVCYRAILAEAPRLLGTSGRAVLEIGFDQEHPVRDLVEQAGLSVLEAARDLGGHVRALAIGGADQAACP